MTNQILVVFVHEFGNLRAELDSALTCNLQLEHSYLVDFSKQLIGWVKKAGYALLDVNLFPKLSLVPKPRNKDAKNKDARDYASDVMIYLWDNYISLTEARQVVLIGHGPGCQNLMDLLNQRTVSVMRSVRAVVQVVGNYNIPATPRDADELRNWYYQHSYVVVPAGHRFLIDGNKFLKKHGRVLPIDEPKPILLITKSFPSICDFITQMIAASAGFYNPWF
ncbi:hypothetical protein EW026_g8342 [Hermanssonia centrifuga]|uniref:Arb2-like domain-containing protein n=1 Tax=Hermanssonia centrifuga TaxID=98765 RepID=A0A4S4K5H7_9APHY|nr:hypothetical protein EW026_g8342 [Hermanssonia centrifuga]